MGTARHGFVLELSASLVAIVAVAEGARADVPRRAPADAARDAIGIITLGAQGSATAFSVDSAGVFLTSAQALAGHESQPLTLRFAPGGPNERSVVAAVAAIDPSTEIAVLLTSSAPVPAFPVLEMADAVPGEPLVAAGYVTTKAAAPDYLAAPLSLAGARKNPAKELVAFDGHLDAGLAGAPVLDASGRVVGLAVGRTGRGPNAYAPLTELPKMLKGTLLAAPMPPVVWSRRDQPLDLWARIVPPVTSSTAELTWTVDGRPPRLIALTGDGQAFHAAAAPVPPGSMGRVRLFADMPDGFFEGTTPDVGFTVGERIVALSEIRRLEPGGQPSVFRELGFGVAGPISGLEPVTIAPRRGSSVKVDLTKARVVVVDAIPQAPEPLHFRLAVRKDDRVVAEKSGPVAFEDAPTAAEAEAAEQVIPAVKVPGSVRLPEPARDVCVGGGGRYLVAVGASTLTAVDLATARVAWSTPLEAAKSFIAAGRSDVVVVFPETTTARRYDLLTGRLERSQALPIQRIHAIAMGASSSGPLVVRSGGEGWPAPPNYTAVDLSSLSPSSTTTAAGEFASDGGRLRASADGTVFTAWSVGMSSGGIVVVRVTGSGLRAMYEHDSAKYLVPGPDGREIFAATRILPADLMGVRGIRTDDKHEFAPALEPGYYVSSPGGYPPPRTDVREVLTRPGDRLVGSAHCSTGNAGNGKWHSVPPPTLTDDQRVVFVPSASLFACVGPDNQRIDIRPVDVLGTARSLAGASDLYFESTPPRHVRDGGMFVYHVQVRSKAGGVGYRISSGPTGMRVTSDGVVHWAAPFGARGRVVSAVVAAKDRSGVESFQDFQVTIE